MPSPEIIFYIVIVLSAVYIYTNYYSHNVLAQTKQSIDQNNGTRMLRQRTNDYNEENNSRASRQQPDDYDDEEYNDEGKHQTIYNNQHIHVNKRFIPRPRIDPLRKFDYDAVNDDFTPPFRRSYYDDDPRVVPGLLPRYTRGLPGRFRKIGVLVADKVSTNDKYKFLLLMGRQRWIGGDYEYFATSPDADNRIKFFICNKNKEISNGENVKIHELDEYVYTFREDKDLSPLYDPYIV